MNFQISPIGIGLLAVYSALVLGLVALPLGRLLRSLRWKWALIAPPVAILLALPWAEEAWIAWHFAKACEGAGVHVYRKVEAEGYLNATTTGWSTPELITDPKMVDYYERSGFRFMERLANGGKISHVEKLGGQWQVVIQDRPEARYHYRNSYQPTPHRIEEPIGWRLERLERHVVDSETGEVIGRDTMIKRRAGSVERLWIGLLGSDLTICPDPSASPVQPPFPESVLVPAARK